MFSYLLRRYSFLFYRGKIVQIWAVRNKNKDFYSRKSLVAVFCHIPWSFSCRSNADHVAIQPKQRPMNATDRSLSATIVTMNESFGLTNVLFLQIVIFLHNFATDFNFNNPKQSIA